MTATFASHSQLLFSHSLHFPCMFSPQPVTATSVMARLLRLRGVRIALKPSAEARASLLPHATAARAPVATPMTLVARMEREGRAGAVQA